MLRKIVRAIAITFTAALVVLLIVVCIPLHSSISPIEPRPRTQYWKMAAGYQIAYTHVPAEGESRKTPIVVLHGGPGGYIHSTYIETFGRLALEGHDVYLYDQIGSGLSDRLPKPKDYTFNGHAQDLYEIVSLHLNAKTVILVGQSYGGKLTGYFVARHPERVEKAVLMSPGGIEPPIFDEHGQWVNELLYPIPDSLSFSTPPDVAEEMGISSWPVRSIMAIALATTLNRKLMPDEEADGVLNSVATRITRGMVCDPAHVPPEEGGGGFYAHGWSNWYGGVDNWRPQLREVDVPVLVVQGECDYIPYASAYEYVDLLPNGTYAFIQDAGHVIWWEQEDALVQIITEFLSD